MKQRAKTIIIVFLLIISTMLLTIGGTYAYLTSKTETKENTFTVAPIEVLDATLDEEWDPETGLNMIPGSEANKKPFIKNTSVGDEACDEWIAMRFTLVYASGNDAGKQLSPTDLQLVMDNFTINYDDCISNEPNAWTRVLGTEKSVQQTFIYNSIVAPNDVTGNLFNSVSVNASADNTAIDALNKMGGFIIRIEGFAIQSEAYASADEWNVAVTSVDSPVIWDEIETTN